MACPCAAHAPPSVEGAALWAAGTACVTATMEGLDLDIPAALAAAREMGTMVQVVPAAGSASRRAAHSTNPGDMTHGG